MNPSIEDQLRDYFTMLDRMQGHAELPIQSPTPKLSIVSDNSHDPNTSTMEDFVISPDHNQPKKRPRTWLLVAATVAAVALVGGLIVAADLDSDEAPANQPTITLDDATAGRYRVDTLGAPFLIDVPDGWDVQLNELGFFVIGPAGFFGPENPGIVMMRPSNLADPSQPGASDDEQADDWPLDDIKGWIDALVPGVVDGEPVDTTVGGLDAVQFDVDLSDEVECGDEFFGHGEPDLRPGNLGCIGLATNRDVRAIDFYRNPSYRVWWIDGGDEAPIVISVGDGGRESTEFIEQAEAVLDTMTFESVGPNPIPSDGNLWESGIPDVVPAGTVTLPVGPGVTLDMSEPRFVFHQDDFLSGALVQVGDRPVGQTDIFFPDQAFDGQPLGTVDEVVGALERQPGLTATVIGAREISGYEATEVNIESSLEPGPDVSPPLGRAGQPDVGWIPQPNGTLWVMETPDGLAVITTGWTRPAGMEAVQAFSSEIIDSIVIGN